MIRLDHLVIVAPSLEDGVAHVRETLGVEMPFGGQHPNMGTHNHLLRLGSDVFLEVIAVDRQAPAPPRARWFGLDDAARIAADWQAGRRLRAFVANTDDLAGVLARHGSLFGTPSHQRRGSLSWQFALPDDGALIADGALPYLIEWADHTNPAAAMPDLGCRLVGLVVEHPEAETVRETLASLTLIDAIEVRQGEMARLRAEIETPDGVKWL